MARDTIDYRDRIATDPRIMVGKPVVKGTRIPVERVIRQLADNPDMDDLYAAFPELTREDMQAVLDYAHARVVDAARFQSQREFYREAVERDDIRRILAELAK